jgi:DNA repair exonuclease SbcCD ATPase subunit
MILFDYVRFKNFGSFGNYLTTIDLKNKKTTLVSGNNGNGKSFALLDSITFALFGKPFRKINIPQLVNSINQKDCYVEVQFSIGKSEYKVCRGIAPKMFEIYHNGKLLDQDSKAKDYQRMLEEQILKMNYKSFTQVVILGSSSFIPFMQLSAADRRAVIEDILDINIFSIMNTLVKGKISTNKDDTKELKYQMTLSSDRIVHQEKFIQTIEDKSDSSIKKCEQELTETQTQIELSKEAIKGLQDTADELLGSCDSGDVLTGEIRKLDNLSGQMEKNIQRLEKEIAFYTDNDNCPTCNQEINEEHKTTCASDKRNKIEEITEGMNTLIDQLQKKELVLSETQEIMNTVSKLQNDVSQETHSQNSLIKYASKLQNDIAEIMTERGNLIEEKERLEELRQKTVNLKTQIDESMKELYNLSVVLDLLKDKGIKAKIIKYYLPIMNKLINKYLTAMDFFVKFTLDENFNETIQSRHRDEFSYMSFSEGEKMRIDLALLLSWREVARMKNSANTNLLILDEVFDSSLDASGTEEFIKLLHALGKDCNIFVISHKSDQLVDKFPDAMTFVKKNNFSKMV